METTELINLFKDFFEIYYKSKLDCKNEACEYLIDEGKKPNELHLVIDFQNLLKYNMDLVEALEKEPEETIKIMEVAVKSQYSFLPKEFTIRIKNYTNSDIIPINELRSKHLGKLIKVEGYIRQKSNVKPHITNTLFECPACGTNITILQLNERKFTEPKRCGCGRKAGFRELSSEKIDVFSMMLEESTEFMRGGSKLSRLRALARAGLSDVDIERQLMQGGRVEMTGILKETAIFQTGTKTPQLDWYIDVNYIKLYEETYHDLKWNENEIKEFYELADDSNWLNRLRMSIFYDIEGFDEECEGVVLQLFGGVSKKREGLKVKGVINILLVGDPGISKSSVLKLAYKFSPKGIYAAGTGVTGTGLTASVVKDELLGGFTLEAGAIVLAHNGLLALDELDKVNDDNKNALHEPLSDETVSINKANIQATMMASTSVLSAANPKYGTYSLYDSVYSQIDLPSPLINRFDLIYPMMGSQISSDKYYDIGYKILSRGQSNEKKESEFKKEWLKKYIAYAKKINPVMSENVKIWMAEKFKMLCEKRNNNNNGNKSIPITPRNLDSMRRLVESVARSRLHREVSMEDAQLGYQKMMYSLSKVGVDPDTGMVVEELVSGKKIKQSDLYSKIIKMIKDTSDNKIKSNEEPLVEHDEIIAMLEANDISQETSEKAIKRLLTEGEIIESKRGRYRCI